jgi:hypothetical protein
METDPLDMFAFSRYSRRDIPLISESARECETQLEYFERFTSSTFQEARKTRNELVDLKARIAQLNEEYDIKASHYDARIRALEPCPMEICADRACSYYHSTKKIVARQEYWRQQKKESDYQADILLYSSEFQRSALVVNLKQILQDLIPEFAILMIIRDYIFHTTHMTLSSPSGFAFCPGKNHQMKLFYFHKNCIICGKSWANRGVETQLSIKTRADKTLTVEKTLVKSGTMTVCGFRKYFSPPIPIPRTNVNYSGDINNYVYKMHVTCARSIGFFKNEFLKKEGLVLGSLGYVGDNKPTHISRLTHCKCSRHKICYHRLSSTWDVSNKKTRLEYFD